MALERRSVCHKELLRNAPTLLRGGVSRPLCFRLLHEIDPLVSLGYRRPVKPVAALETFVETDPLATPTRCLGNLLSLFDRRLHVVPATLELAKSAFSSHLTLKVLDRTLDALVAHLDFQRPALN